MERATGGRRKDESKKEDMTRKGILKIKKKNKKLKYKIKKKKTTIK